MHVKNAHSDCALVLRGCFQGDSGWYHFGAISIEAKIGNQLKYPYENHAVHMHIINHMHVAMNTVDMHQHFETPTHSRKVGSHAHESVPSHKAKRLGTLRTSPGGQGLMKKNIYHMVSVLTF